MITLTSAQLDGWIAMLIFPLARILALIASAPITSSAQFPVRAKIGLAVMLTVLLAPLLPATEIISGSATSMLLLVREVLIGIAMGMAMRVVFAAVSMAGDVIGLQMGLGFAQFYDPQSSAHVPVTGQFLGLVATLIFLSLNGHLLLLSTLVESFQRAPALAGAVPATNWLSLAQWGGMIMRAALLLSLPVIAVLLITNITLAVLSKAATQLNIFAIGFPITLGVGFIAMLITLPTMSPALTKLFSDALQVMLQVATIP